MVPYHFVLVTTANYPTIKKSTYLMIANEPSQHKKRGNHT